ncbi:MAG: hypothetical protein AVDCRST_MAG54-3455, partial [uncultured Actinomycetospora sp.]
GRTARPPVDHRVPLAPPLPHRHPLAAPPGPHRGSRPAVGHRRGRAVRLRPRLAPPGRGARGDGGDGHVRDRPHAGQAAAPPGAAARGGAERSEGPVGPSLPGHARRVLGRVRHRRRPL